MPRIAAATAGVISPARISAPAVLRVRQVRGGIDDRHVDVEAAEMAVRGFIRMSIPLAGRDHEAVERRLAGRRFRTRHRGQENRQETVGAGVGRAKREHRGHRRCHRRGTESA
jgi:hypothetical protein